MRVRGEEPRPPTSTRPAWAGLLVAALVCAVLTAALGGCPRMRALTGSAVDTNHRPFATTAPRAVPVPRIATAPRAVPGSRIASAPEATAVGTREAAGSRCHGGGTTTAVPPAPAPAPRAHACASNGTHRGALASAPPPAPGPRAPRRMPGGRPEPLLRV
ncbi:hypothetical protein [Streptomyces sp. WP-1]|uniref:hypothetical protein n=1 Tax=Streptomyces sp. WP-1 TaxID=3041497 RepID=UPI0026497256|nr:hypothetical protein [Streptomyces sp. WP-1]WKE73431.1 hypothetical protein QHG49_32740 [Streptomyces sp. WP-1]